MQSLLLTRDRFTKDAVTGLLDVNGVFQCYILERPWSVNGQTNVERLTCIPNGTYKVAVHWSRKFGFNVLWVEDVPDRTNIEVHPADFPSQLLGCLAPGESRGEDNNGQRVYQSVLAFTKLMAKMSDPNISLTIQGNPPIMVTDIDLAT